MRTSICSGQDSTPISSSALSVVSDADSVARNNRNVLNSWSSKESSIGAFRNDNTVACHWCAQHGRPLIVLARNVAQHYCQHFTADLALLKKQSTQFPNSHYPQIYRDTKEAIISGQIPPNLAKQGSQPAKLAVKGDSHPIRKAKKRNCTPDTANKENEKKRKISSSSSTNDRSIFTCTSSTSSSGITFVSGSSSDINSGTNTSASGNTSGTSMDTITRIVREEVRGEVKALLLTESQEQKKRVAKELCVLKASKSSHPDEIHATELALQYHGNMKGLAYLVIQGQKGGQTLAQMKSAHKLLTFRRRLRK